MEINDIPSSLQPRTALDETQRKAASAVCLAGLILSKTGTDAPTPEELLSVAVFILSGGEEMVTWHEVDDE